MTVSTFVQTNFTIQLPAVYKANIDAAIAALAQLAADFAPHEQAVPNMTVLVDAGNLRVGGQLIGLTQQVTGTLVAPSVNPRIDRLALRESDGILTVFTGVENAVPVAPIYPLGYIPVASLAMTLGMSVIGNAIITDDRAYVRHPRMEFAYYSMERAARSGRLLAALNLT